MQNYLGEGKRAYRYHDIDFKRHVVGLCGEPGASVSSIAREHGINANMLFTWRKQYAVDGAANSAVLLPVQVKAEVGLPEDSPTVARLSPCTSKRGGVDSIIEIEVSGAFVRLSGSVDEASLCSVLRAVRGSA